MTGIDTVIERLYLLQLSTTTIPGATGQKLEMSSGCYLVQTSDGKNILIDSGLPVDYAPPPGMPLAENEKNVLEHLAIPQSLALCHRRNACDVYLQNSPARHITHVFL